MIKKLLLKVGFMLGGLFAVLMFLPGPGGKPIMSWEDLPGVGLFKAATELAEEASEALDDASGGNQVYQWIDENGTLHYSDTPIEGATAQKISAGNDPIPSDNFTGVAFQKKRASSKPKTFLINDSRFKPSTGSSNDKSSIQKEDFEALIDGDYSNAREVVKQLPDYLQKAHQERMKVLKK